MRAKDFIYDKVELTELRPHTESCEVVLTTFVDGLGDRGDVVAVRPYTAYNKLLLPGLAVYKTPENVAKYARKETGVVEKVHSSRHAQRCVNVLESRTLQICMNLHNPWVLEPWHVRVAFRKAGINVLDDSCIQLPDQPITGPNLDIQDGEFFVTVTVNNCEKARVRCRLHHWSNDPEARLPYVFEHWKLPGKPIFESDAAELEAANIAPSPGAQM